MSSDDELYDSDSADPEPIDDEETESSSDDSEVADVKKASKRAQAKDEDPDSSLTNIQKRLLKLLDDTQVSGKFAATKVDDHPVNPGISIECYGPVGIPVSPNEAKACLKSEAGGSVDDSEHTACKVLSSNQFTCRNQHWQAYVESVCRDLLSQLGELAQHCALRNPRLFLCGNEVSPIIENDSSEETTGTLLVCMPTELHGVTLHVQHNQSSVQEQLSESNQFSSLQAVWLKDTSSSVRLVGSGYFMAIAYDIVSTSKTLQTTAASGKEQAMKVRECLDQWGSCARGSKYYLGYKFKHITLDANPDVIRLSQRDKNIVDCVKTACEDGKFIMYLARLERVASGDAENEHGEVSGGRDWDVSIEEDDSTLVYVESVAGDPVGTNFDFRPKNMIEDLYPDDRYPDEEDAEQDYRGDVGTITHTFRDLVLLIMKCDDEFKFLVKESSASERATNAITWINDQNDQIKEDPNDKDAQVKLVRLCSVLLEEDRAPRYAKNFGGWYLDQPAVFAMIDALMEVHDCGEVEILRNVIALVDPGQPGGNQIPLEKVLTVLEKVGVNGMSAGLGSAFNFLSLGNRNRRLKEFEALSCERAPSRATDIRNWSEAHLTEAVATTGMSNANSGTDLADLIMDRRLLPILNKTIDILSYTRTNISLAMEFLDRLVNVSDFTDFAKRSIAMAASCITSRLRYKCALGAHEVTSLLFNTLNLEQETAVKFGHLLISYISSPDLRRCITHHLRRLASSASVAHTADSTKPIAIRMFTGALLTHIFVYDVGQAPERLPSWQRPGYICPERCFECRQMNTFLRDPQRQTYTSSQWKAGRRDHVYRLLTQLPVKAEKIKTPDSQAMQVKVEKTEWEWERAMNHWRMRLNDYRTVLTSIAEVAPEAAEIMLGDRRRALMTEDLTALRAYASTDLRELGNESSTLKRTLEDSRGPLSENPNESHPNKRRFSNGRKIEVIDLCE